MIFRSTVAMIFSVSKLVRLVLIGAYMIYFIHLHHVTSRLFKESHYLENDLARPYYGVFGTVLFYAFAEDGKRDRYTIAFIFSGEARGFGGLSVTSLLQILDQCDLPTTRSALSKSGMSTETANDDPLGLNYQELMHAPINIVEEFHRQGVRREVFGSLFPRHQSLYSKRSNRLNKLLRKHVRCEYYKDILTI